MITLGNISKRHGHQGLLMEASMELHPGEHVGNPFAGSGNGNVDINALFRQFGGESSGSGNPFGGLGGR